MMRPLTILDMLIALLMSICSCNPMPECRNWLERVAGECGDGCGRTEEVCVRGRWVEEQCSSYLVPGSECIPGDMKEKSCGPDSDQAGRTSSVCESNCRWGKWSICVPEFQSALGYVTTSSGACPRITQDGRDALERLSRAKTK